MYTCILSVDMGVLQFVGMGYTTPLVGGIFDCLSTLLPLA